VLTLADSEVLNDFRNLDGMLRFGCRIKKKRSYTDASTNIPSPDKTTKAS
jgi:hypothetical protein